MSKQLIKIVTKRVLKITFIFLFDSSYFKRDICLKKGERHEICDHHEDTLDHSPTRDTFVLHR